jgi:hypothetical protein
LLGVDWVMSGAGRSDGGSGVFAVLFNANLLVAGNGAWRSLSIWAHLDVDSVNSAFVGGRARLAPAGGTEKSLTGADSVITVGSTNWTTFIIVVAGGNVGSFSDLESN